MTNSLKTIILAAGKGTRMKSDVPKVLHKVCGRPMIQYVIDAAQYCGSLKTYVVVGYKGDDVKRQLSDDLLFVEQPQMLGTGDAVKCAHKALKNHQGDVLVLCGDTPLLNKKIIRQLVRQHQKEKAACTFLTAIVDAPDFYGRIIRDENGQPIAIREHKDATLQEQMIEEINVGVYCFDSGELFKALAAIKLNSKKQEFYLTDVIEILHSKVKKIQTITTDNPMEGLGINTREELAVAESCIRFDVLRSFMENGVTIIDPTTTFIDYDVKIGVDTVIHPFSFIEKNVKVGKKCSIGPFARLRTGTVLEDEVEIGNFTEVVRTRVGKKTYMKHFSYLGDATIGKNVNVGAGTVIANYDGKNKHQTSVGDNVFLGSDSVIISPSTIGKNAMIGAGSVVTRNSKIPQGAKAVGVPAKLMRGDRS